jgi:hypothetical protein
MSTNGGFTNSMGQVTETYTPNTYSNTGSGDIQAEVAGTQVTADSREITFTMPSGLPATDVSGTAAPESGQGNLAGDTASATVSGNLVEVYYASNVSNFATVSAGGATILTPESTPAASPYGSVSSGDVLAVWPQTGGDHYLDLTSETPGAGSTSGDAYVGFEFPTGSTIWYVANGQLASSSTPPADLYVPVAQLTGPGQWSPAPQMTVKTWITVNGTVYQFNVQQP